MNQQEINARLESLREREYPLSLSFNDAEAIVECIKSIMSVVSDDDIPFVRGDYALATSALCHPEPNQFGTTNQRLEQ